MNVCPCGFGPYALEGEIVFSPAWRRAHRDHHLAFFPDVDQGTRDNLDMFIREAEALEAGRA